MSRVNPRIINEFEMRLNIGEKSSNTVDPKHWYFNKYRYALLQIDFTNPTKNRINIKFSGKFRVILFRGS